MISIVILAQLFGADIGPEAPAGVYVMARENAVCRGIGDKTDRVALVVEDTRRVRRPTVRATVAALYFRDGGVTRPGDVIETIEFNGARAFHLSEQMVAVITSPGCTSQTVVLGADAKACLMVVLECSAPDAGAL